MICSVGKAETGIVKFKILEAGVCAPSGGNMQRWRFLGIRDPQIKQTVGAYYKRAWDEEVAPRYRAGSFCRQGSPNGRSIKSCRRRSEIRA
jgi:nitroreductase